MVLNLEVVITFAQYVLKLLGAARGLVELIGQQQRRRHPRQAGRESNQAVAVLGQKLLVDARLVVIAPGESQRGKLDQVLIALKVLCQQDDVIDASLAALFASVG